MASDQKKKVRAPGAIFFFREKGGLGPPIWGALGPPAILKVAIISGGAAAATRLSAPSASPRLSL